MASASLLVPQARRSISPSLTNRNDSQRQSLLSNNSIVSSPTGSYKTAPLSAASHTSLASSLSSVHTISATVREGNGVNPIYALAGQQEVHIVKVTNDTVQIEPGPVQDSYFGKVGKRVLGSIQPDSENVGPPPPSPPASVEQRVDDMDKNTTLMLPPVVQSDPSVSGRESTSSSLYSYSYSRTTTQPEPLQRSSTDTRASYRNTLTTQSNAEASSSKPPNGHLSVDGATLLSAPQRPARRNTTGSTPLSAKRVLNTHGKGGSQPYDDAVLGEGGVEIASDIELHAERIRRERMSKRAKQQQEAEAALTRAESLGHNVGQDTPLVGNLIGEGHVNYVLMYNMLTGIRIGVRHEPVISRYVITDFYSVCRFLDVRPKLKEDSLKKTLPPVTSSHSICAFYFLPVTLRCR